MLDLTNYIGLKNCTLPDPESGLYVNDLPGMSTELVDKIANSEQINFSGVWASVQKRALLRLSNDVTSQLYEWVKLNQIIYQTRRLLKSQPNGVIIIAMEPLYAGIYQMVPESKYAEFRLNDMYIYSFQTVTTTLKVWDMNDGSEIYTKSIDLVPGLNHITQIGLVVPLKYRIMELFIGVDVSGFDSIQTLNDYYYWYTSDAACAAQTSYGYGTMRGVFQFMPATYDPNLPMQLSNLIRGGIGRGVCMGAEIRCSVEQFIYDNRQVLSQALLYLMGAEILLEKIGSPRLNYFTSSNLESTEMMRQMFENRYKSNLKSSLNIIPLNGESICFDCEETFQVATKVMMP